ncbi:hypothetical protein WJX81_002053 [Elliptochloris bilobata]|uniref:non-specific serine/threonine protein kinase n=1 Tax=Elliptochloris bilobata TaxID=381761 RepID=A0AAW1QDM9_9CHLO
MNLSTTYRPGSLWHFGTAQDISPGPGPSQNTVPPAALNNRIVPSPSRPTYLTTVKEDEGYALLHNVAYATSGIQPGAPDPVFVKALTAPDASACNELCLQNKNRHWSTSQLDPVLNCTLWRYCLDPDGCRSSSSTYSALDTHACQLQSSHKQDVGFARRERDLPGFKAQFVDNSILGAPIQFEYSDTVAPTNYSRYPCIDLVGLYDFSCPRSLSYLSQLSINKADNVCWVNGSLADIATACNAIFDCDAFILFPKGTTLSDDPHYISSGFLKSARAENKSQLTTRGELLDPERSLDFFSPLAITYFKYATLLEASALKPSALTDSQLIAVLEVQGLSMGGLVPGPSSALVAAAPGAAIAPNATFLGQWSAPVNSSLVVLELTFANADARDRGQAALGATTHLLAELNKQLTMPASGLLPLYITGMRAALLLLLKQTLLLVTLHKACGQAYAPAPGPVSGNSQLAPVSSAIPSPLRPTANISVDEEQALVFIPDAAMATDANQPGAVPPLFTMKVAAEDARACSRLCLQSKNTSWPQPNGDAALANCTLWRYCADPVGCPIKDVSDVGLYDPLGTHECQLQSYMHMDQGFAQGVNYMQGAKFVPLTNSSFGAPIEFRYDETPALAGYVRYPCIDVSSSSYDRNGCPDSDFNLTMHNLTKVSPYRENCWVFGTLPDVTAACNEAPLCDGFVLYPLGFPFNDTPSWRTSAVLKSARAARNSTRLSDRASKGLLSSSNSEYLSPRVITYFKFQPLLEASALKPSNLTDAQLIAVLELTFNSSDTAQAVLEGLNSKTLKETLMDGLTPPAATYVQNSGGLPAAALVCIALFPSLLGVVAVAAGAWMIFAERRRRRLPSSATLLSSGAQYAPLDRGPPGSGPMHEPSCRQPASSPPPWPGDSGASPPASGQASGVDTLDGSRMHAAPRGSAADQGSASQGDGPPGAAQMPTRGSAGRLDLSTVDPDDIRLETRSNGDLRTLGSESMDKVYLGHWRAHGLVAVKPLIQAGKRREEEHVREVEMLQSLRHPNIVSCLGAYMEPGQMLCVSEYVPNGSLEAALRKDNLRSAGKQPRVLGWYLLGRPVALDVAQGLAFLHAHKIVHQHIKPINVLLSKNLTAKISVLGFAKSMSSGNAAERTQKHGLWVDPPAGGTPSKLHGLRAPKVPEECPQEAADLCLRCLSREPSERPTAIEVVETIKRLRKSSKLGTGIFGFQGAKAARMLQAADMPDKGPAKAPAAARTMSEEGDEVDDTLFAKETWTAASQGDVELPRVASQPVGKGAACRQIPVEASSQLIAHFGERVDVAQLRQMVEEIVEGYNLIRSDVKLRYRISPFDLETLNDAVCVSPELMEQLNAKYLIEEKDSLAVQVPREALDRSVGAELLTLEFWRGTLFSGMCSLPLKSIQEAKAQQEESLEAGSECVRQTDLRPDLKLRPAPVPAGAGDAPSSPPLPGTPSRAPSRAFQLERWAWDVFICHAGEDKAFGLCLHRRLVRLGLRSFLDEQSLRVGGDAPAAMQAAVRSTQVAVVLLSEEFFRKECPQRELHWFLEGCPASRNTVVPVFLGVTVERCAELAARVGLVQELCGLTGLQYMAPAAE